MGERKWRVSWPFKIEPQAYGYFTRSQGIAFLCGTRGMTVNACDIQPNNRGCLRSGSHKASRWNEELQRKTLPGSDYETLPRRQHFLRLSKDNYQLQPSRFMGLRTSLQFSPTPAVKLSTPIVGIWYLPPIPTSQESYSVVYLDMRSLPATLIWLVMLNRKRTKTEIDEG